MDNCLRSLDLSHSQVRDISIIGTGNFGSAIGKRIILSGRHVTYGRRRPNDRSMLSADHVMKKARVVDIETAICKSDVILLAIPVGHFQNLAQVYQKHFSNKIVIDVSNRSGDMKLLVSNAEYLQSLLPEATVVKAFNVISAYTLGSEMDGSSRVVPIASEDNIAKEIVANLVKGLQYTPRDAGGLRAARDIEASVSTVLPMWRMPVIVTLCIFLMFWLYLTYLYFVKRTTYKWEQLFVKILNKPLCMSAVNLFALTYLPGCLAGFLQLYNGTKYKRFPRWFDSWLRSRKQLGLMAFALASMHVLISAMLLSPTYYSSWFHNTHLVIPANLTHDITIDLPVKTWMIWKGEIACMTGVFAFCVFCVVAVTSLPSVGQTLNWAEWRFVQSGLGTVGLFLTVAHAYVMGFPNWIQASDFLDMFESITFMSTILPVIIFILKCVLILPGVRSRIRRIRHGWERKKYNADEEMLDSLEQQLLIMDRNACCCSSDANSPPDMKEPRNITVNGSNCCIDKCYVTARINNRKPGCCKNCDSEFRLMIDAIKQLKKPNVNESSCVDNKDDNLELPTL